MLKKNIKKIAKLSSDIQESMSLVDFHQNNIDAKTKVLENIFMFGAEYHPDEGFNSLLSVITRDSEMSVEDKKEVVDDAISLSGRFIPLDEVAFTNEQIAQDPQAFESFLAKCSFRIATIKVGDSAVCIVPIHGYSIGDEVIISYSGYVRLGGVDKIGYKFCASTVSAELFHKSFKKS